MSDVISSHWGDGIKENGQRSPLLRSLNSSLMCTTFRWVC